MATERTFHPVHGELMTLEEVNSVHPVSFGTMGAEFAQLVLPAMDMKRMLHTLSAGLDEGDALQELRKIRETLRPLVTGKYAHLYREGEDALGFLERLAAELGGLDD